MEELGVERKVVGKEYGEGMFVFGNEVKGGDDGVEGVELDEGVVEVGLRGKGGDGVNMLGVGYE
ncbi:hypothetical protein, partial [Bacillus altitudinis]|uniref:hypothetical protein n=1 Tax=Bacillus altitudinis TaxID=293387 RepID=UPI001C931674